MPQTVANQNRTLLNPSGPEALWEVRHQEFLAHAQKLEMQDYSILKEYLDEKFA